MMKKVLYLTIVIFAVMTFKLARGYDDTRINNIYLEGNKYLDDGQYDKAIDSFSQIIQELERLRNRSDLTGVENNLSRAYLGRGFARKVIKKYSDAIADFSKVIEINPKSAIAYAQRGQTRLLFNYDATKALEDLDKACALGFNDKDLCGVVKE